MRHPFAVLILAAIPTVNALPCTTFCLSDDEAAVFGQNYDWTVDTGVVAVNKRGLAKASLDPSKPFVWTAQYGSVTFNQYGIEFPVGGMNERGLVVATMWLDETQHEPADDRPSLNILQWIQYQLDSHETVDQVVASTADLRIDPYPPGIGLHYLVADAAGGVAAIEVLEGRVVLHRGDELTVSALANSTYAGSVRQLTRYANFGGTDPLPADAASLSRFTRAADRVRHWQGAAGAEPTDYAMETLAFVANPRLTQWSIVYDQSNRRIAWRTRNNTRIRTIDFSALDFSCTSPRLMVDIDAGEGDVAPLFIPYSPEANRQLVIESFTRTTRAGLDQTPESHILAIASYPSTTLCTGTDTP
jgi:choloylglycine hydrolase